MKVIIVEDEPTAVEELTAIISTMPGGIEVVKILSSVADTMQYLETNTLPDLIISEIQLCDGKSFDIFKQVKINVPVIYCTAHKEYLLEAYKNNGIDHILKPFAKIAVKRSLEKYYQLREHFSNTNSDYKNIIKDLQKRNNDNTSLLVNWKDKIIPVKIKDIALFSIEYKSTQAITFSNKKYYISNTLEELEEICGNNFYRANRQFLINREAMVEAEQHFARKLLLNLNIDGAHQIIISKNKVPEFLNWLRG